MAKRVRTQVVASFDVKGMENLQQIVAPGGYRRRLNQNVQRATLVNANVLLTRMRAALRRGLSPKNAALTILIKGHPLAGTDTMQLYKSLKIWRTGPLSYYVGVPASDPRVGVARILHEGAQIRVTEKMRMMFLVLYEVSFNKASPDILRGRAAELYARYQGPWYPLDPDTDVIRIRPRPFIDRFVRQKSFQKLCQKRWAKAVEMAMNGRYSRAGASLGNVEEVLDPGSAANENAGGGG